jgi:hypothetical protein
MWFATYEVCMWFVAHGVWMWLAAYSGMENSHKGLVKCFEY